MMKPADKVMHARQAARGSLNDLGALLGEQAEPVAPVAVPTIAVADLPAAADYSGHVIFCSNGAAGNPILAYSDGTDWLRSDTGAAVAAA